jgi:hypothetical protein
MSVNRRIFGLASAALAFAGVSFGQALVCVTAPTVPVNSIEVRLEGTTELVSDYVETCNGTTSALVGNVSGTISGTGNLTISSRSQTGGVTEATLQIIDNRTPPANVAATQYIAGTVSGNTVNFPNVTFPQYNFRLQISNIRVNATSSVANTAVNETFFAAAQGVALVQSAATPVGLVRQGLTAATVTYGGTSNFLVCNGGGAAFTVTVGEMFAGAFKTQHAPTATNQSVTLLATQLPVPPANLPGGEDGSYIPGGTSTVGTATSGTRVKFVFAGIPNNVALSVPLTVTSAPGGLTVLVAQLQGGTETGAFSPATSGTLASSGGVATAIYEVTAADLTVIKSMSVQVTATFTANTVVVPAGPITVTTSYAPSPSAPNGSLASPIPTVPYFANTGTTLNGSTFSACQTTLLFPFVTNQQNFETGIAIANTGLDNLGVAGKSVATGQSGACTITFYGSTGAEGGTQATAPTAANFPASTNKPTTSIAPGTTHADTLTDILTSSTPAGASFQGYAIAVCPFLYARGFAFIESGFTTSAGVVEGYLADVISNGRLALGTYATAVGNASPEASGH